MFTGSVTVVNSLGLHARAAAQLVRMAAGFRSRIILRRPDKNISADAKSILSVLTLAAAIGTKLEIEVEGEDAQEAFRAVSQLFERGFGEVV